MKKIVEIHWNDSQGSSGWTHELDRQVTAAPIVTLGWLLEETEDTYSVACHWDEGNNSSHAPLTIPKSCVTDVWEVTLVSSK